MSSQNFPRAATFVAMACLALVAWRAEASVRSDFDGDGKADLLWRTAVGRQQLWLMNGTTVRAAATLPATADAAWRLEAVDDFDGDSRADLVFRHADSGESEIWFMNGATVLSRASLLTLPDTDWRVAASGDFNGDGKADLIWRHEALGRHNIWFRTDGGPPQAGLLTETLDLAWRIAASGDANNDGRTDLLWRHAGSGANRLCLQHGIASTCADLPARPGAWRAVALADLTGDAKADIVWQSGQNGAVELWTLDGTTLVQTTPIVLPGRATIVAVADFDGDGQADIAWRSPNGSQGGLDPKKLLRISLMNGAVPTQTAELLVDFGSSWGLAVAPPPAPPPPPNPPGQSAPTEAEAIRFLEQCTMGPTTALVARVRQIGYAAFIDEQFALPASPYFAPVATASTTNDSSLLGALRSRFFINALTGQDQLRQRVFLAVSQIVAVSANDIGNGRGMALFEETLSVDALANYFTLLADVTLNPVMGDYLDMVNNDKRNPNTGREANENYARELLQLFSVGVVQLHPNGTPKRDAQGRPLPTYDQDVIEGLARALTGWTYPPLPGAANQSHNPRNYEGGMVLWPSNHDTGAKLILGGTLPAGQSGVDDLYQSLYAAFQHPNVGPFIGKQLIQHLVTSNPSPGYVARVSAAFGAVGAANRGDLRAVVKAILLDPEARRDPSPDVNFGLLRDPLLFMTTLVRQTGASGQGYGLSNYTQAMAQYVFTPPTVFSFYPPSFQLPGTALLAPQFQIYSETTAVRRANFVNTLIYNTISVPNYAPAGSTSVTLDFGPWIALAPDPAGLASALDARFFHGRMSAELRATLIAAVGAIPASDTTGRAKTALYLVATSPLYEIQR